MEKKEFNPSVSKEDFKKAKIAKEKKKIYDFCVGSNCPSSMEFQLPEEISLTGEEIFSLMESINLERKNKKLNRMISMNSPEKNKIKINLIP